MGRRTDLDEPSLLVLVLDHGALFFHSPLPPKYWRLAMNIRASALNLIFRGPRCRIRVFIERKKTLSHRHDFLKLRQEAFSRVGKHIRPVEGKVQSKGEDGMKVGFPGGCGWQVAAKVEFCRRRGRGKKSSLKMASVPRPWACILSMGESPEDLPPNLALSFGRESGVYAVFRCD